MFIFCFINMGMFLGWILIFRVIIFVKVCITRFCKYSMQTSDYTILGSSVVIVYSYYDDGVVNIKGCGMITVLL